MDRGRLIGSMDQRGENRDRPAVRQPDILECFIPH